MDYSSFFEENKATWNKKVAVHTASDFYSVQDFLNGKSSLNSYELNALGNVSGKSILHLQCHFGQDTLSWSRMGAKCTGIDISDEAIKKANSLASTLQLPANFVCCNVLDTSKFVKEKFDFVFTSYGTIGWLPDLKPWAKMIAERLKKGGTFYIVEFHPIVWMFDYLKNPPELEYAYHSDNYIYEEYKGTYADMNSNMISKEYTWNHSFSSILTALLEAGLTIQEFKEHDASPYNILPNLEKNDMGYFELKKKTYPLLFSIKATLN